MLKEIITERQNRRKRDLQKDRISDRMKKLVKCKNSRKKEQQDERTVEKEWKKGRMVREWQKEKTVDIENGRKRRRLKKYCQKEGMVEERIIQRENNTKRE